MSERVLVVPAELVDEASRGRSFWSDGPQADQTLAARLNAAGRFAPRSQVETDESLRQIIPYLLLRNSDGAYFAYRRLPTGGEARLFDRYSLGVGGHINDERVHTGLHYGHGVLAPNLIAEGLQRELAEELDLPDVPELGRLSVHGFLALDETPVDRVHMGLVVRVDIATAHCADCHIRETDRLEAAGWFVPAELERMLTDVTFEGWSRTLIEAGLP
ncbi:MAG: hypothetical protein HZB16_24045 [Armatimonadetes bacterium]|nr:hypothetical protein [Armatimonadota bacterium]